jgi:adenine deaminase
VVDLRKNHDFYDFYFNFIKKIPVFSLKAGIFVFLHSIFNSMQIIKGNLIDLHERRIYTAQITVENQKIQSITALDTNEAFEGFLLPGFVDAHVHIESSMLPPTEFARLAVVHGTVATVSDPHEIANVLGLSGVEFMLKNAQQSPLKFCFGAPSCVPATIFETAGATLDVAEVTALLENPTIGYLSEMMNFPGVLYDDEAVLAKIKAAQKVGKPIDGHAPGLRGMAAQKYFSAGISTDHECFTYEEGREKALLGVKILIREGSAARNFEALWQLIHEFPQQIMFCSDDKHPDDLIKSHINALVARAIEKGCDLFDTLRAACIHPVEHYGLAVGQLRVGDAADFIKIKNLTDFEVTHTWINGELWAENGVSNIQYQASDTPNHFLVLPREIEDFGLKSTNKTETVRVIEAFDGQIVTGSTEATLIVKNNQIQTDGEKDILKIVVVNRYAVNEPVAVGFVKGFGLKKGAIASSVAHDSHNIVAVGVEDSALCAAINAVIAAKGGISAYDGQQTQNIALPIAGLMSDSDGYELATTYATLDNWTKNALGCTLRAPFMVLSFLALPVIPALKMTDLGLFDVEKFGFVTVLKTT